MPKDKSDIDPSQMAFPVAQGTKIPRTKVPKLEAIAGSFAEPTPESTSSVRAPNLGDDGPFEDRYEFLDDVQGSIHLNRLERDVVDTPEFQRLFRLGQLGFVDLVYPTANHTRGVHSLGACFWSKKLVDTLNENNTSGATQAWDKRPHISRSERVLIGLGGLLHDIPHGPFSHDIEKKTHHIYPNNSKKPTKIKSHYGPYEKHDNFEENPALFVFLLDVEHSLLARVLRRYSPGFARLLVDDGQTHPHLASFVEVISKAWPKYEQALLPSLLFHLLVYEKPDEAENASLKLRSSFQEVSYVEWGLGPKEHWQSLHSTWYQPFRHDIIGDTLSADLIDYLMRDQARLGMKNQLDLKLLTNYILVPFSTTTASTQAGNAQYRCAVDLNDYKRGTFRAERLNDIFRLLDLRHQIHEKAVYHRVVQSATAMLARAGLILGKAKPSLSELYGFDAGSPALAGDDRFLESLITKARHVREGASVSQVVDAHQTLPYKLAERRVYRPLMVIPGDRVPVLLNDICNFENGLEHPLRELAAILDSTFFSSFFLLVSVLIEKLLQHAIDSEESFDNFLTDLAKDSDRLHRACSCLPRRVIFWTTPYKQLYKDPAILVRANNVTTTIEHLQSDASISASLRARVMAGIKDAETKNEGLWKFYVFLSDGLFYTGALAKLRSNHVCAQTPDNHEIHLTMAQNIVVRSLRCAWQYWQRRGKSFELGKPATIDELSTILGLFVADSAWFKLGGKEISHEVSAVKVTQYLHGDNSPKCRDIRYKFDAGRKLDEVLDEIVVDSTTKDLVRQTIRATGIDPDLIKGEEMAEVVVRLAAVASELPEMIELTARNSPVREDKLISVWLSELK